MGEKQKITTQINKNTDTIPEQRVKILKKNVKSNSAKEISE